jgi:cell division protein FtsN
MADQHFREIQLSGKQLVFLFMASVVLAVSVFLLGVSVGRGVRDADAPVSASNEPSPPVEFAPPEVMPAPTEMSERDSAFEQLLPGQTPDRETAEAEPLSPERSEHEAPPEVNEPVEASDPPPTPEPAPARQTAAAQRPAAVEPPAPAPGPDRAPQAPARTTARTTAAGHFTVQVNAYRSRASADEEAASLASKGYDAYVDASGGAGLFRVRVGSYPNRSDAERTAARLRQEGMTPLVTR